MQAKCEGGRTGLAGRSWVVRWKKSRSTLHGTSHALCLAAGLARPVGWTFFFCPCPVPQSPLLVRTDIVDYLLLAPGTNRSRCPPSPIFSATWATHLRLHQTAISRPPSRIGHVTLTAPPTRVLLSGLPVWPSSSAFQLPLPAVGRALLTAR